MNLSMERVGLFLMIAGFAIGGVAFVVGSILFMTMPTAITPVAFTMNGAMVVALIGVLIYGKGSLS